MRIVFCWSHISGYMAACWRALASRPGIELHVLAFQTGAKSDVTAANEAGNIAFADDVMQGISCRFLSPAEKNDPAQISSLVRAQKPDVIVMAGWLHPPYMRLVTDPALKNAHRVMTMDTPLKIATGSWKEVARQYLGHWKLRQYLAAMAAVVVAGERAWQFARLLGIPERKIMRGVYGIDLPLFAPLYERRLREYAPWPRRFLHLGRYESVKGIDVLLEAHARYRSAVGSEAWPLTCCGMGPMRDDIVTAAKVSGGLVEDRCFVQPADQPPILASAGVFVLASRYEPWGVVVAETAAAGLPVICTEACSAGVEIVRSFYNGLTVPTGDAAPLARAMRWVHEHESLMPAWGDRSRHLGAAFAADRWADRWEGMLKRLA